MNTTNRELLDELTMDCLQRAIDATDEEERETILNEVNKLVDRQTALYKIDVEYQEHCEKIEKEKESQRIDEENKRDEAKRNRKVQIGMFVAGLILTPTIDYVVKSKFADRLCTLEQFETFTTTAGRSISGWFKWKN